jgi:di/tricarboxylate transporter
MSPYLKLYESMLTWYRQWYTSRWHLHFVAASALAGLFFLNTLSVVNVISALGLDGVFHHLAKSRTKVLGLMLALMLSHYWLAFWKSKDEMINASKESIRATRISKRAAVIYMLATIVGFAGSWALLLAVNK